MYVKAPGRKAIPQSTGVAAKLAAGPLLNWTYYRLRSGKPNFTWGDLIYPDALGQTAGPDALLTSRTRFNYFADPVEAHIILGIGAMRESEYTTKIIEAVNGEHTLRLKLLPSARTYVGILRRVSTKPFVAGEYLL